MSVAESKNTKYKRMAKNAGMLYFRMLLTMGVTLYTSRVVLQALGIDDFGIYHVVAGFVTMLGFLNSAMASATQRFLAFELGKPGDKDMPGIFSMSMNIHMLIALFVLILGETVGLWFVRTQMTIPADRLFAAEWVFHLTLLSFMLTIISVPYNALIIANERMSVFAWVSIIDVTLKLLIVFMLGWFGVDKLILYGLLTLLVVIVVFITYRTYCNCKFKDSRFRLYWEPKLFKIMLSYTGWNLWGNVAAVMSGQGVNVLLNIFFGPTVNAGRAIAMQVSGALNNFVQNIQMAVNPQIIKSYAEQNMDYMHRLVCYGAKYNFFVLFVLSIPVLINTELILETWLGTVPEHTSIFLKLIIVNILIDSISAPLMTSAQATGRIRLYQSVVGSILLLNVPLSYLLLKLGSEPHIVIFAGIFSSILAFLARLVILKKLTSLPVKLFLQEVVIRSLLIVGSVWSAYHFTLNQRPDALGFWLSSIVTTIFVLSTIFILGFDHKERSFFHKKLSSLFQALK
ncbi:lipopolysaccharide biosynthesis protein [Cycloclasticus pugetii]|uniref:lipopolysaccharide biosynthesis protein n=1 Tax=Cycloclasticus pugetii TaxID=34068 RepID=UPI003A958BB3